MMGPQTAQVSCNVPPDFAMGPTALRAALQTPGAGKLVLREYFDKEKADKLMDENPLGFSFDHAKKLDRVLRAAKQDPSNKRWYLETSYDFSVTNNPMGKEKGLGRLYGDVSVGTLPKDTRNYIVTDCADIDIENSHPTCLLHVIKQAGFAAQAPCLAEYVEDREHVLSQVGATYTGLKTRDKQKEAVLAVLNGGSVPQHKRQATATSGHRLFLHELSEETRAITRLLMADPRFADEAAAAALLKGPRSFLHFVMSRVEVDLLLSIACFLVDQGRTIRCLIYDGLLVELDHEMFDEGHRCTVNSALLEAAEAHVLAETGCAITLACKPMCSSFDSHTIDDAYAASVFARVYGKDNLKYVHGVTHCFDKTRGQWRSGESAFLAAACQHRPSLLFKDPNNKRQPISYGGDVSRVLSMMKEVHTFVDNDDQFFLRNLDSSRGKLLFKDGIYDFDTYTFTYEFDNQVVFVGRIDFEFDRCEGSEAKAEIMKVMWQDPYTHKQLQDRVP
eukprot:gene652-946_t